MLAIYGMYKKFPIPHHLSTLMYSEISDLKGGLTSHLVSWSTDD